MPSAMWLKLMWRWFWASRKRAGEIAAGGAEAEPGGAGVGFEDGEEGIGEALGIVEGEVAVGESGHGAGEVGGLFAVILDLFGGLFCGGEEESPAHVGRSGARRGCTWR